MFYNSYGKDTCLIKGGINILRVIAGSAKGHKLKTLKGDSTRPTSDRVKESLFNIIAQYIPEAEVLDLFAGTGNLGIEALSRGAKTAVFVDKNRECQSIINENLQHTKLFYKGQVFVGEVMDILKNISKENRIFDIIFLDPPYNKNLIEETLTFIDNNGIISEKGIVIAERDFADTIPVKIDRLELFRDQKYGDTVLSFYKIEQEGINR